MVFDDDRQITLARDVKPVKPGTLVGVDKINLSRFFFHPC
jgi:hypothetical protein